MKLLLSEYVRSLKERNELDRLLPDLLLSMGIIPLAKTQTGTRQFGVDLAAVGSDSDRKKKLFLFVVKSGDLGRKEWDDGPQSIRQSLNEIFDVYLHTHVSPAYKSLPRKIVLVTSGDMKQELVQNWAGYISRPAEGVEFHFWGADDVAVLMEEHLLNENMFPSVDRHELRRALALAGEVDYKLQSLYRLYQRHLELGIPESDRSAASVPSITRRMKLVNLTTKLFSHWAMIHENSKNALIASERALLWNWHKIKDEPNVRSAAKLSKCFDSLWQSYDENGQRFLERVQKHYSVEDGLCNGVTDNAILSVILFEHIGIISSLGLAQMSTQELTEDGEQFRELLLSALISLIQNNACSGSPRLDEHVIDINLGLLFLVRSGRRDEALAWLQDLIVRIDFAFSTRKSYVPANSIEELFTGEVLTGSDDAFDNLSWLLPTLADWSIFLERADFFSVLSNGARTKYPNVCQQLFHPSKEIYDSMYFHRFSDNHGKTEAPIEIPDDIETYRNRMQLLLNAKEFDILQSPPSAKLARRGIDFIACRHFRTLIPPFVLYSEFKDKIAKASESQ